jgi:hypothetical protein
MKGFVVIYINVWTNAVRTLSYEPLLDSYLSLTMEVKINAEY